MRRMFVPWLLYAMAMSNVSCMASVSFMHESWVSMARRKSPLLRASSPRLDRAMARSTSAAEGGAEMPCSPSHDSSERRVRMNGRRRRSRRVVSMTSVGVSIC